MDWIRSLQPRGNGTAADNAGQFGWPVNATFSFYPLLGNPDALSGSFAMTGSYSAKGVVLAPAYWISEPPGYEIGSVSLASWRQGIKMR